MNLPLQFDLRPEDDWPPVGSESLPFESVSGGFKALEPPLYVKELAVEDIIRIIEQHNGFIEQWEHVHRSGHSTMWLLRMSSEPGIKSALTELRSLGCKIVSAEELGSYSVDIPETVRISDVDDIVGRLDPSAVAVAFPCLRHEDSEGTSSANG